MKSCKVSPSNLALYCWQSHVAPPKGTVQLCHGMAEHAERYQRFAEALNQQGYHCYAHDHRGHGETTADGKPGLFATKNGLQKVTDDIATINDLIASKHPGLPIVLVGHSMGAILALYFACLSKAQGLAAVAFLNSKVDAGPVMALYRGLLRAEALLRGWESPSIIAPKLTFGPWNRKFSPNRTPYDWLSRDETEVDKFVADPLCGSAMTTSLWFDVTTAIQYLSKNEALGRLPQSLPIYLVGGAADPCTDYGQAIERLHVRMKQVAMTDLTCKIWDDTRHETLNEINRDQATSEFIEWLDGNFD